MTALDPTAWALVFGTELTNVSGADIALGSPTTRGRENAGYGGLFWRGPRSFTGGTLVTPAGTGGDGLRGQCHSWMAFAGRLDEDDARSLVLMADAGPDQAPGLAAAVGELLDRGARSADVVGPGGTQTRGGA
ncbi:DUF6807 family protein [Nonomuraea sp. 10N515B]|uniref:DUF6807 family protein n=1 Tax=Nonomuraea sp. 10N515B TaxID=3457422 RepID=UPI003FCEC4EF